MLIVLWVSFGYNQLFAQNTLEAETRPAMLQDIVHDASHAFNVGIGILQSPFNATSTDWRLLFLAGASTSVLFLVDPAVKEFVLSNQTKRNDNLFGIDRYYNSRTESYAAIGLYFTGFIFRREKLRRTGLYATESIIIAQTITGALKYSFGRRRPYGGDDHLYFRILKGNKEKYKSLPSGHTSGAFAFATVIAKSVDHPLWKTFWYGSAAIVGMARIYHNVHWLSDTVLAGFIGYSVASYVVHFSDRKRNKETGNSDLTVCPFLNTNGIGFTVYF